MSTWVPAGVGHQKGPSAFPSKPLTPWSCWVALRSPCRPLMPAYSVVCVWPALKRGGSVRFTVSARTGGNVHLRSALFQATMDPSRLPGSLHRPLWRQNCRAAGWWSAAGRGTRRTRQKATVWRNQACGFSRIPDTFRSSSTTVWFSRMMTGDHESCIAGRSIRPDLQPWHGVWLTRSLASSKAVGTTLLVLQVPLQSPQPAQGIRVGTSCGEIFSPSEAGGEGVPLAPDRKPMAPLTGGEPDGLLSPGRQS